MKKQYTYLIYIILIPLLIALGIFMVKDRSYRSISVLIALLSCIPFYLHYESRKPQAREVLVIAIMCALAIVGRTLFAFLPGFKPISAIVILAGMAFGAEAGFLCGSLSALLSNMFFGQGPWTPFQMFTWGMIGFGAGLFNRKGKLEHRSWLMLYGAISGVAFSVVMDIWSTLSLDGNFSLARYRTLLVTSIPFMITYAISNCFFLWIMVKPFMRKLKRIRLKYGIGEENDELCDEL